MANLSFCWSMIVSENRYPLFGIMLLRARALFHLDSGGLYHLGPALAFFADERRRGRWIVASRVGREGRVARDHLGLPKGARDVAADVLGKRVRGLRRRRDREPGVGE